MEIFGSGQLYKQDEIDAHNAAVESAAMLAEEYVARVSRCSSHTSSNTLAREIGDLIRAKLLRAP